MRILRFASIQEFRIRFPLILTGLSFLKVQEAYEELLEQKAELQRKARKQIIKVNPKWKTDQEFGCTSAVFLPSSKGWSDSKYEP